MPDSWSNALSAASTLASLGAYGLSTYLYAPNPQASRHVREVNDPQVRQLAAMPGMYNYRRTRPSFRRDFRARRRTTRPYIRPRQRGFLRTVGYFTDRKNPRIEEKFREFSMSTFNQLPSAQSKINMVIVPQGASEKERIGRRIKVMSLNVHAFLRLLPQTDEDNTTSTARIWVVQDKQTNGTTFGATDMLETDTVGTQFFAFNKLANKDRFKVLYDRKFPVSAYTQVGATPTSGATEIPVDIYLDFKKNPIVIEYSDLLSGGETTTQRSNSLWVCALATTATVLTFNGNCRIRFVD